MTTFLDDHRRHDVFVNILIDYSYSWFMYWKCHSLLATHQSYLVCQYHIRSCSVLQITLLSSDTLWVNLPCSALNNSHEDFFQNISDDVTIVMKTLQQSLASVLFTPTVYPKSRMLSLTLQNDQTIGWMSSIYEDFFCSNLKFCKWIEINLLHVIGFPLPGITSL